MGLTQHIGHVKMKEQISHLAQLAAALSAINKKDLVANAVWEGEMCMLQQARNSQGQPQEKENGQKPHSRIKGARELHSRKRYMSLEYGWINNSHAFLIVGLVDDCCWKSEIRKCSAS